MLKNAVHPRGNEDYLPARLSPEDFDRLKNEGRQQFLLRNELV